METSMSSSSDDAADNFGSGIRSCAFTAAVHAPLSSRIFLFNMYSASSGSFPKYQESSSATNF